MVQDQTLVIAFFWQLLSLIRPQTDYTVDPTTISFGWQQALQNEWELDTVRYTLDFYCWTRGFEGDYTVEDIADTVYADLDMETLAEWLELELGAFVYSLNWLETAEDDSGSVECDEHFRFTIPTLGVISDGKSSIPEDFLLLPLYPNPFNSMTNIRFRLPSLTAVQVTVIDLYGREIEHLTDRSYSPGYQSLTWDAVGLPAGVYLVKLEAGDAVQSRKVVLLK